MKSKNFRTEKGERGTEIYSINGNLIRGILGEWNKTAIHTTIYIYDEKENFLESKFIGHFKNVFEAGNAIMMYNKMGKLINEPLL